MLDELTMESFAPHVGASFPLALEPDPGLALTLTEVQALADLRRGPRGDPRSKPAFSLIFHGPPAPILPQRIYPLVHPTLGPLDIFIVPLGPENGRMRYQAIFY